MLVAHPNRGVQANAPIGHLFMRGPEARRGMSWVTRLTSRAVVLALVLPFFLLSCSASEVALPPTAQAAVSPLPATPTAVATALATSSLQKSGRSLAQASLEAESSSVDGSAPLAVEIVLDNVVDLYGAEVHLAFDPAVLQVQDADPETSGEQIALGEVLSERRHFVAVNRVDNQKGTIDLVVTLVNPAEPLQGRLVLATFSVLAVGAGTTEVRFNRLLLADARANAIGVMSNPLVLHAKP